MDSCAEDMRCQMNLELLMFRKDIYYLKNEFVFSLIPCYIFSEAIQGVSCMTLLIVYDYVNEWLRRQNDYIATTTT